MTTEPSPHEVAQEWSRQPLGHDQSTDIPSLLRWVSRHDYVVPAQQIDAAQLAIGSGRRAHRAEMIYRSTHAMRRQRLIVEITQFEQQFFELSCEERNAAWQTLFGEATEHPDLMARLARLQSGLDVECPPEPEDANEQRLWKICREIFLASPPVAAKLRAAMLADWNANAEIWDHVTRTLIRFDRAFYRAVAPWLIQFQKETCAEALEARHLLLLNPRKFYAIFFSLVAVLAIGWMVFQGSMAAMIIFPSLLATLIAWMKGYRPWYWLLSLPQGLIVILLLPVCWRLPPRRRRQQRNRGNDVGLLMSGLNLVIGMWLAGFITFEPPSHDDRPRQHQTQVPQSPVATPPIDRESPRYKAAYEATRILMGIPDDATPEQKAIIERGFSPNELPQSGQPDRSR